ncbi:MAG: hypothetical protein MZV64_35140 [Ignavibacteriales bacterium]|nr:hypothetical protein [Ignavibacteriales bacterium]
MWPKKHKAALVVKADSLDALADLTEKIQAKGVEDMVLDLGGKNLGEWLARSTQVRRLALKSTSARWAIPIIIFAAQNGVRQRKPCYAAQAIAKYAGFVVLDTFAPETDLSAARPAREHLHRPAETDPGPAGHLRDQLTEARQPGAGHDQLQHHLLRRRQRSGRLRPARLAGGHGRGRHVRADRMGGGQVRCGTHRQSHQGLRRGEQGQQEARCPARSRGGALRRTRRGTPRLGDPRRPARGGGPARVHETGV